MAGDEGSIGTNDHYLRIDTMNNGTLEAVAKGGVYIEDVGGINLIVASTSGWNDVNLIANGGIVDASSWENPNIYAKNINLTALNGNIGAPDNDLNINLDYNLTGGILNATASGSINISQDLNCANLKINKVYGADDVILTSATGIIDASADETPNIKAKNLTLNAVMGSSIGTFDNPVDISLNGGNLSAFGYGFINLKSDNDIVVNVISNAGRADTELYSINGSIVNGNTTQAANIITRGLTLNVTPKGSIGTDINSLNIDTNFNSTGGKLIVLARDYININEVSGDLAVDAISNAGRANINVNADWNIYNATVDNVNYNIYGKSIALKSQNGRIGAVGNPLDVFLNYMTTGGSLKATANNGMINIRQPENDLIIDTINSGNNIILNSSGGIYTNTILPTINISGHSIDLTSPIAIGTKANKIKIKIKGKYSLNSPDNHVNFN